MNIMNSYGFIIGASVIVILSYLFNLLASKRNIPSVLLLITLGIVIKQGLPILGITEINLFPVLEVLGIIGLIMIVLEASLDLKITKEKSKMIVKSFLLALLGLVGTSLLTSTIIMTYVEVDFLNALVYSIPMAIMSSAIIIPSVSNLDEEKKEFLIYEGTFSDILGIMFFYLLLGSVHSQTVGETSLYVSGNILVTILVSIVTSFIVIFIFQNIRSEVKLFLLIAVLVLFYSLGKLFHLSSLLIILVFGLILENRKYLFDSKIGKYFKQEQLQSIYKDFKLITLESSFVVRTFFFVIFGMTISLSSLWDLKIIVVSLVILGIIYGLRWILFKIILKKDFKTHLMIAPRGLITILLFFGIPEDFKVSEFKPGVLLFVIIISSFIMAYSLISDKKKAEGKDSLEESIDTLKNKGENSEVNEQ